MGGPYDYYSRVWAGADYSPHPKCGVLVFSRHLRGRKEGTSPLTSHRSRLTSHSLLASLPLSSLLSSDLPSLLISRLLLLRLSPLLSLHLSGLSSLLAPLTFIIVIASLWADGLSCRLHQGRWLVLMPASTHSPCNSLGRWLSLTSRLSPLTSYLISHLSPPTHLHLSPLLSSLVSAASSSWSGACISLGRWLVLTTASRPMACPDACMNTQSLQLSGPMACPDASPPLLLPPTSYFLLLASSYI